MTSVSTIFYCILIFKNPKKMKKRKERERRVYLLQCSFYDLCCIYLLYLKIRGRDRASISPFQTLVQGLCNNRPLKCKFPHNNGYEPESISLEHFLFQAKSFSIWVSEKVARHSRHMLVYPFILVANVQLKIHYSLASNYNELNQNGSINHMHSYFLVTVKSQTVVVIRIKALTETTSL